MVMDSLLSHDSSLQMILFFCQANTRKSRETEEILKEHELASDQKLIHPDP